MPTIGTATLGSVFPGPSNILPSYCLTLFRLFFYFNCDTRSVARELKIENGRS